MPSYSLTDTYPAITDGYIAWQLEHDIIYVHYRVTPYVIAGYVSVKKTDTYPAITYGVTYNVQSLAAKPI